MRAARIVNVHTTGLVVLTIVIAILTGVVGVFFAGRDSPPVYQLTDGVSAPVPLDMPAPEYTPLAKRAKVQGAVRVRCVVRPTGLCTDVVVVRSLDTQFGLDMEAIRAVRGARFRPGTKSGNPVSTRIDMEVRFALR
jgi:protein TonB